MSENPYLSGNFAPVEDELDATDLPVTGSIPRELEGRLLRIGPNPVVAPGPSHHWFLGNGMVHGVRLRGGRAQWYRRRYVRDDEVVAAKGWPEVPGPRPEFQLAGGVANTHVIADAGRIFALVEGGNLPVELDPELELEHRDDAPDHQRGARAGGGAEPRRSRRASSADPTLPGEGSGEALPVDEGRLAGSLRSG